jgi:hypothetical protein
MNSRDWISPKGFKGVLMMRASQQKKARNQHQELTVSWKMPVGTASQWATLVKE